MWKLNIENSVNAPITTKRVYSTYNKNSFYKIYIDQI